MKKLVLAGLSLLAVGLLVFSSSIPAIAQSPPHHQVITSQPWIVIGYITGGRGITATIIVDCLPAVGISWNITIKGGTFGHVYRNSHGYIPFLDVGDTATIHCGPAFGFRAVTISIEYILDDGFQDHVIVPGNQQFFYTHI